MISAIKNFFFKIFQKFVLLFGLVILIGIISLVVAGAKLFNDTFSSEPIQGEFKVEKAEIITPKKSTGGGRKKRVKTTTDGVPYLSINLIDDNGSKLKFSYKDVKNWKWNSDPPSGLDNIRLTILNASSITVKYRKGMLFSKIIDEVALAP
tara:strand:- start:228 stop:680 length:453 start_codon:yes stop_codon:yes gene_type:complete